LGPWEIQISSYSSNFGNCSKWTWNVQQGVFSGVKFDSETFLFSSEAFFGHGEESKKVLELGFTPEDAPFWAFWVHLG